MRRLSIALSLIALATLIVELSLIRTFDVLFYPNIAYMIVTSALFALGLGGVYSVLRPPAANSNVQSRLARWAVLFALATIAILPIVNALPFDFNEVATNPVPQLTYFTIIYLALGLPFFLAGLIFSNIFAAFSRSIQSLYFWDLAGAAIGSIIIIPLIPVVGPGGLLFFAAALGLFASSLLSRRSTWGYIAPILSLGFIVGPLWYAPKYFDFVEHQGKRGIKLARENGLVEQTIWDPVSKIDVIDYGWMQFIAYDGGSQNSTFYPFDGDFKRLRDNLGEELANQFWNRGVLASHYLLRDSGAKVLIIGSAGGQEVKAALMYGASEIDGIEMVRAVVELGQVEYADYIGNLFQHNAVNVEVGEGRSYLRATQEKYDIIQIFSNHTSSSVASGTGAMATTYLQTAEAYQEYFSHLTDKGILHINHHVYPRMITTAALAWQQMGWTDFQKHVVVFHRDEGDTLPTFLVKMRPWTAAELAELTGFFFAQFPGETNVYHLAEDPLHPDNSLLAADFYQANLTEDIIDSVNFRIEPATDNKPYFNFTRSLLILLVPRTVLLMSRLPIFLWT
jgi:spermidine synthase